MENANWAIPFSATFVLEKITNFCPFHMNVSVEMVMNLRIKLTELPMQELLMEFLKEG